MEKIKKLFLLAMLYMASCLVGFSQHDFVCDFVPDPAHNTSKISTVCNQPTSTLAYIPDNYTVKKTIKINMHFMCKSVAQPMNFTATSNGLGSSSFTGYDFASTIVSMANSLLGSNEQMRLPIGNSTPVLPINYRFELMGTYFHYDANLYTYNNAASAIATYRVNPTSEINVFYFYDPNNSANGGAANMSGNRSVQIKCAWQTYATYNDAGFWGNAGLLKHEAFHCLGLHHSVVESYGCCAGPSYTDYCNDTPDRWTLKNAGQDPCCGVSCVPTGCYGNACSANTDVFQCSNNFMDYSGGAAMTPEQLGRVDYTIMNELLNYVKGDYCTKVTTETYVISGQPNLIWQNSRLINRDIIIEPGSMLTIKCRLHMAEGTKIIVKQGARLVIDGGELTNSCGAFWAGIEVWGTSSQNQYPLSSPTYQGKVELKNGAIIEHAREAITTWKPDDWSSMGGVVVSNGAIFKNNRRSVEFMSYTNTLSGNTVNNFSNFNNTTFTVDNNYRGLVNDFAYHVSLWEVTGVAFRGCTFENARTSKTYSTTQCKGIYSLNAGFTVAPTCSEIIAYPLECPENSTNKTSFKGFNYGIHANGSGTTKTISIDKAMFDNNVKGIEIEAQHNFIVTRSEFTIGQNNATGAPTIHEGIISISSSGYKIEGNKLIRATTPVASAYGIRVDNSGAVSNRIYRNTTERLYVGEYARGVHRHLLNGTGLQILCNSHSLNMVDIAVSTLSSPSVDGIRTAQGDVSPAKSAGNIFSPAANNISNSTSWQIDYYHTNGNTHPVNHSTMVTPYLVSTANTCPSTLGGGLAVEKSISHNAYAENEKIYRDLLYDYTQLTEKGNAPILFKHIRECSKEGVSDLKKELLSYSPYLSMDIIQELAFHGIFSHEMLLEICLANPESTKSEGFISFIGTQIPNPMPAAMLDMVRKGWDTKTVRYELEGRLAYYSSAMSLHVDEYLGALMIDSIVKTKEIQHWLRQRSTLTDQYHLVESYIEEGNYQQAEQLLLSIPDMYILKEEHELAEHLHYIDFLQIMKKISTDGRKLAQLTPGEITQLQLLAEKSTDRPCVMSQNILCFFYGKCREAVVGLPSEVEKPISSVSTYSGWVSTSQVRVDVFPNPADDIVTIQWQLPILSQVAKLVIRDIVGRVVIDQRISNDAGYWQWNLEQVKGGVYNYDITLNNKQMASGKIIVNK